MELDIQKAVIHVLNRDSEEPLLNEFELEVTEDLYAFLEKHIIRSINDDAARKGRFREGRNIVREVCLRIAEEPGYFLEGSRDIARQLFKSMKTNSSISSTDLVICFYEAEGEGYTAILKMDYTTSFIHDIEVIGDKFKISILKQEISLPGVNQKIQKCAFVKGGYTQEYDMVILDNQIGNKNEEEPVAQFFLQTFLGAELVSDSKASTIAFKRETENWIRAKAKEGEASAEEIRQHVHTVIHEEENIDIEEFSCKAFGNKQDLREDYMKTMKEKGFENEKFDVDREWVDKRLSRIRLKTNNNIEISISYEDFNNREVFEITGSGDGTRNIIIKNVISLFEK